MVSTSTSDVRATGGGDSAVRGAWAGWGPVAGIGFVVLVVASAFLDNSPNANDSNAKWTSYYASSAHQVTGILSGFLGVIAAVALLCFVAIAWTRLVAAGRNGLSSLLVPLLGTLSAVGIAVGFALGAVVPGGMIFGSMPEPSPDVLRVLNQTAGPLILVAGMIPLALAIAILAVQARRAGTFGRAMVIFSMVMAVITLFAFIWFTALAPLIWILTVSILLIRRRPLPA